MNIETPLISCVCVTRNRPNLLSRAVACYHAQTYPNKELVILYEQDDRKTAAFVDGLPEGLYRTLNLKETTAGSWTRTFTGPPKAEICIVEVDALTKRSLGILRNMSIEACQGPYICMWDDDDWYHPDRLNAQMQTLNTTEKPACTLARWILYDELTDRAYHAYSRPIMGWEGSLLCRKQDIGAYPDLVRGEDVSVVWALSQQNQLVVIDQPDLIVHVYHGKNTWHREHFLGVTDWSEALSETRSRAVWTMMNTASKTVANEPPARNKPVQDRLSSPDLFIQSIDMEQHRVWTLQMDRAMYSTSVFLDKRAVSVDGKVRAYASARFMEPFRREQNQRFNAIFHTAFCGSTLLCNCLDHYGICLPYKEPFPLHQLSFHIRRNRDVTIPGYGVSYLDIVLKRLSQTYTPDEVALIKPSDSCINLARPMLAHHPENRALLLYATLPRFLVAMLKGPQRRSFLRSMIFRAQKDLDVLGLKLEIEPDLESDAQVAGLVWTALMYSYLDLLADTSLKIRSLSSTRFFTHPVNTLMAVKNFFGLHLEREDIDAVVDGGAFSRNAKATHLDFESTRYQIEQRRLKNHLKGEIDEATAWVTETTRHRPIPSRLPRPLLS